MSENPIEIRTFPMGEDILFFSVFSRDLRLFNFFVFLPPIFKTNNYVRNFRKSSVYNCRKTYR